MTYKEKLLDPRWQKKRLEILNRDRFCCQICGDEENTLHIHHLVYKNVSCPWEYKEEELVTLCATCHEAETECMKENNQHLNYEMKLNFFSGDMEILANSIRDMKFSFPGDVISSILEYWITDRNNCKKLEKAYFGSLKRRVGKNK